MMKQVGALWIFRHNKARFHQSREKTRFVLNKQSDFVIPTFPFHLDSLEKGQAAVMSSFSIEFRTASEQGERQSRPDSLIT